MPAWWRGKSCPDCRRRETVNAVSKPEKKETSRSFDEAVAGENRKGGRRYHGDGEPVLAFDSDGERKRHPLPPPLISASSLSRDHSGTTTPPGSSSVSESVSSVSSSGSDEIPDLGIYRYSDPINTQRGRNPVHGSWRQQHVTKDTHLISSSPVLEHMRFRDCSISPRTQFQVYGPNGLSHERGYSHRRVSSETMCSPRSRTPGPGSTGYNPSTSPVQLRAFGRISESPTGPDGLTSSTHPLPLPPSSPTSSASHSFKAQWKKGKLLGRGSSCHVFVGFNRENGQMCAIKEVKVISDDSNSKACLKQLAQEITVLGQLSHPNIVQYYGSELAEDTLSVYLEYVSGGSIHKLLQDYGPFSEPVIQNYATQILSGLAYLHGRNKIHRDIKGANILVDPNGIIKLADFGLAKHVSSSITVRSFKGSPYWMAPEVVTNTGGYNLAVDIWSLGCTILEMATSKPPWWRYEGIAALFKIGNSKDIPEFPDHLSHDGKDFLKLCLQRDPSARPTAAQLLDHPFVRDQAAIKVSRSSPLRDVFPSFSDGSHTETTTGLCSSRSISPLHDRNYPAKKSPSDLVNMKMISPCSSPLRNSRPCNRSCIPSPHHPSYVVGTINSGLGNPSCPSRQ